LIFNTPKAASSLSASSVTVFFCFSTPKFSASAFFLSNITSNIMSIASLVIFNISSGVQPYSNARISIIFAIGLFSSLVSPFSGRMFLLFPLLSSVGVLLNLLKKGSKSLQYLQIQNWSRFPP